MDRRGFLGVAGGSLLLAAGFRPAAHPVDHYATAAIAELVEQASAAWTSGDFDQVVGFLGGHERSRLRRAFDVLHAMPATMSHLGLLENASPTGSAGEGQEFEVPGFMRHRVAGADPGGIAQSVTFRLRRIEGGLVMSDIELAPSPRHMPWDFGPMVVRSGPGVVLITPEAEVDLADARLAAVLQGVAAIRDDVGDAVPATLVVYQGERALANAVFMSQASTGDGYTSSLPTDAPTDARRITLDPQAGATTVAHEVAHVVQFGWGLDGRLRWVQEGAATWAAQPPLTPVDLGITVQRAWLDDEIRPYFEGRQPVPAGQGLAVDYLYGSTVFSFMEEAVGRAAVWNALHSQARSRDRASLSEAVGYSSFPAMMDDWRDWVLAVFG